MKQKYDNKVGFYLCRDVEEAKHALLKAARKYGELNDFAGNGDKGSGFVLEAAKRLYLAEAAWDQYIKDCAQ